MGIFSNIMAKIFPGLQAASTTSPPAAAGAVQAATAAQGPSASSSASEPVDVAQILTAKAAARPDKLNWHTSIVDLMKLLDPDSSLSARKELAQELQFSGDMSDSASMNICLHKQVMRNWPTTAARCPRICCLDLLS